MYYTLCITLCCWIKTYTYKLRRRIYVFILNDVIWNKLFVYLFWNRVYTLLVLLKLQTIMLIILIIQYYILIIQYFRSQKAIMVCKKYNLRLVFSEYSFQRYKYLIQLLCRSYNSVNVREIYPSNPTDWAHYHRLSDVMYVKMCERIVTNILRRY